MARLTLAQARNRGRTELARLLAILASATNEDGTEFALPTADYGELVSRTLTTAAAGDTAVWTPAAGKRFRLLGAVLSITGDAAIAAAGRIAVLLNDGTTSTIVGTSLWLPAASTNQLGNLTILNVNFAPRGWQSGSVNRVLNVNLSAALTVSTVRVNVWGKEE